MRFRLPVLVSHPEVTTSIEYELVDTLFSQNATLIIGGLIGALVAVLTWSKTGSAWMIAWGIAAFVTLVCRLLLGRAYWKGGHNATPSIWARRFTYGALVAALIWGVAGAAAFRETDINARFLIVTVLAGVVAGAVARNNAAPACAVGQACCMLLPLTYAGFASGDVFFYWFAIINLLHVAATCTTIAFMGNRTVQMYVLNHRVTGASAENARLLTEVTRMNTELEDGNAILATLSVTDDLTGLLNRRGFDSFLLREWRRAERARTPLSLLLVDVDCFKAFNDHYGHPTGDDCLRAVGRAIADAIGNPMMQVARYGGEEFVVVLPETDDHHATLIAETIRKAVEDCGIAHGALASPLGVVTISVGSATLIPNAASDHHWLIQSADAACYRAKSAGRNCVRTSAPKFGLVAKNDKSELFMPVALAG